MTARGRRKAEGAVVDVTPASLDAILAALGDRWPVATGPGWLLVHGDTYDVLPALPDRCAAHLVADPPYEAEAHDKGKRQGPSFNGNAYARGDFSAEASRVVDEEFAFDPITEEQRTAIGAHAARLTTGRSVVFCQVEAVAAWRSSLEAPGLIYRRTIPWVKPDAMPSLHGRWPGQSFEAIVLAQQPRIGPAPVGGKARYYEHTRKQMARDERPHPTMKPDALMQDIIADFTETGDLVIDPYMGSASTGLACLRLGRLFVGIEQFPLAGKPIGKANPDFFGVATRRMRGEAAKPRVEQPSLFSTLPGGA